MYRIPLMALILIACTTNAVETRDRIPEQFLGIWAGNTSQCARGFSESFLTIYENQIDFYASRSRVLSIAVDGELELAVLLESTGEGETWLSTRKFKLSEDGMEITDVTGGPVSMKRIRC